VTGETKKTIELSEAGAWALAEVLRHRAPCTADCEYCGDTAGDRPRGIGYELAAKVQKVLLKLRENQGAMVPIRISEHEAWMIYRYLPQTAYQGARDLLMEVFEIIAANMVTTEMPPWADDLDLED